MAWNEKKNTHKKSQLRNVIQKQGHVENSIWFVSCRRSLRMHLKHASHFDPIILCVLNRWNKTHHMSKIKTLTFAKIQRTLNDSSNSDEFIARANKKRLYCVCFFYQFISLSIVSDNRVDSPQCCNEKSHSFSFHFLVGNHSKNAIRLKRVHSKLIFLAHERIEWLNLFINICSWSTSIFVIQSLWRRFATQTD